MTTSSKIPVRKSIPKKTPFKFGVSHLIYILLGDGNIAMRITMRISQKSQWYCKKLWVPFKLESVEYAAYEGHQNIIHIPDVNRTHDLEQIRFESNTDALFGNCMLKFNAVDNHPAPDLPVDFKPMTPLEFLAMTRCPVPQTLEMNWRLFNKLSTFEVGVVSTETSFPVDAGERARRTDTSTLDELVGLYT